MWNLKKKPSSVSLILSYPVDCKYKTFSIEQLYVFSKVTPITRFTSEGVKQSGQPRKQQFSNPAHFVLAVDVSVTHFSLLRVGSVMNQDSNHRTDLCHLCLSGGGRANMLAGRNLKHNLSLTFDLRRRLQGRARFG